MSRRRRKIVREMTIASAIEDASSEADSLHDEIEEWKSNIEEKFSMTEKYSRLEDCAGALENIMSELEDVQLSDAIRDMEITVVSSVPRSRWMSRPTRAGMAQDAIDAAAEAIRSVIEGAREEGGDVRDLEALVGDLDSIVDDFASLDFPGMFG